MSKTSRYIIIGIGIASILFAIYGTLKGGELIDAVGGIVIGAALVGTVLIEQNKNKKAQ